MRLEIEKNQSIKMAEEILDKLSWMVDEFGVRITETFVVDGFMTLSAWDNCREQGYQLECIKNYDRASIRAGLKNQTMIFAFGEHRNVDKPVLWINKGHSDKTRSWLTNSEDFRSAYGTETKHDTVIDSINECARIIYDDIVEFFGEKNSNDDC